jgi:hypothetical protein
MSCVVAQHVLIDTTRKLEAKPSLRQHQDERFDVALPNTLQAGSPTQKELTTTSGIELAPGGSGAECCACLHTLQL